VLRVANVLWMPRVCSQPQRLRSSVVQCCSGMDMCYWMLKGSSPGTTMVLDLEGATCIGIRANVCGP
jgi:hypothetical protein